MKQSKDNRTKSIVITIGVVVGILSFFLYPFSFIDCTKTPTGSDKTKQLTVNNDITQNTVWQSGTDYIVEGVVTVEKGASLNITGKVSVLFKADQEGNAGKLRIDGSLQAAGTDSTSPVLFKPYDASQGDAWGIELNQSEGCGVFEFCRFEGLTYGVNAFEASVQVNECTFLECVNGVLVTKCDSALIQGSEFLDNEYGIKTDLSPVGEDSVRVTGNVFSGAKEVGVEVNDQSIAVVEYNNFIGCEIGLLNSNYSECEVVYNDFEECELCCEFYLNVNGIIKRNNFNSGEIAVRIKRANSLIFLNNFISFNDYKLKYYNWNNVELNAEYNWWNSVSRENIMIFIWDGNDDKNDDWEGVVDFEPFKNFKLIDCGNINENRKEH